MAPITTDYAEIQQNEIEALHSIFMEDFVEHEARAGAWNVGCKLFKGPIHFYAQGCSPRNHSCNFVWIKHHDLLERSLFVILWT